MPTRQDLIPRSEVRKMIEERIQKLMRVSKSEFKKTDPICLLEELLSELDNLSGVEPLQFTMYDYRGPWASDESKRCIMEQHNRKIMEHYHLPPNP